jgi:hypothetical protein
MSVGTCGLFGKAGHISDIVGTRKAFNAGVHRQHLYHETVLEMFYAGSVQDCSGFR